MSYEIIKQVAVHKSKNRTREQHLVKLDTPALCRADKTFDLYEVDYVLVEAMRLVDSGRTYEETYIAASDEQGTHFPATLYRAQRALTVQEALFGIGEHNYDASIENTDEDTDETTQEEPDGDQEV